MFFETIKIQNGEIFNLDYHNTRMNKTRKDIFNENIDIDLKKYIKPIKSDIMKCRVLYERNILSIAYTPYIKREISSFQIIYDDEINYDYKSNNRSMIDKLFDKKGQNDEILLIKNTLLTDTSIANVAIFCDKTWITPRLPLLNGTMREYMLKSNLLTLEDIDLNMLKKAKKIALINSMLGFYVINNFEIRE